MKNFSSNQLALLNYVMVDHSESLEQLLQPREILSLPVMNALADACAGMEDYLLDGNEKITHSSQNWTILKGQKYFIATRSATVFTVAPWCLRDKDDYQYLIECLEQDKILVRKTDQGEYLTMVTKKDIPKLSFEYDRESYWLELVSAWLNYCLVETGLVNWVSQYDYFSVAADLLAEPAVPVKIKATVVRNELVNGQIEEKAREIEMLDTDHDPLETIPFKKLTEILHTQLEEVRKFIQTERWAYYIARPGAGCVEIVRYADTRAIKWHMGRVLVDDLKKLEETGY